MNTLQVEKPLELGKLCFLLITFSLSFYLHFYFFISFNCRTESCDGIQTSTREKKFKKRRSLSLSLASLDDPELDRLAKEADEVSASVYFSLLFFLDNFNYCI